jgi:hypothetical protein
MAKPRAGQTDHSVAAAHPEGAASLFGENRGSSPLGSANYINDLHF